MPADAGPHGCSLVGLGLATTAVVLMGLESPRCHGSWNRFGRPADACDSRHLGWPICKSRATEPHHRYSRHGTDGCHDAVLSMGSPRATGSRSRFCRSRSWAHHVGPLRRVPGQCKPVAHRYCVRDGRTIAARRPCRGGRRSRIGGVRRKAAAPCSACGARRRPAVVALQIIRVHQVVAIYRQSFGEFLLIVSTTAVIIVLPIEQGVAIGIALSLLHGTWSTTRARVVVFERVPGTSVWWPTSPHIRGVKEPNIRDLPSGPPPSSRDNPWRRTPGTAPPAKRQPAVTRVFVSERGTPFTTPGGLHARVCGAVERRPAARPSRNLWDVQGAAVSYGK
jgi:hypothetical protein